MRKVLVIVVVSIVSLMIGYVLFVIYFQENINGSTLVGSENQKVIFNTGFKFDFNWYIIVGCFAILLALLSIKF